MLELTITFKNLKPMEFVVPTGAPIISALFHALQANINGEPDMMFSLISREEEEQEVYFPRSEIIAIESLPPVDISQIITPAPETDGSKIYPAKLLIQDGFLPEKEAGELFQTILDNEGRFSESTVSTNDTSYRRSRVLYDIGIAGEVFESRLRQLLPEAISEFGSSIALDSNMEIQITASGQGDYFKIHNDNGSPQTGHRRITFVYYLYSEPRPFTGGDLLMYDYRIKNGYYVAANSFRTLKPANNSIVFFPSFQMHEVQSVENSGAFSHSRFTINGWFGNRPEGEVQQ